MSDEVRQWLKEVAAHPILFGVVLAAIARWALGDRAGGWRSLFSYVVTSMIVAWAASYWLADEAMTTGRKSFFLLLAAFVAKDVLVAIVSLSTQFGTNPLEVVKRIRAAIAGGPKE